MVFLLSIGNNGRQKKVKNGLKRQQKMFISGVWNDGNGIIGFYADSGCLYRSRDV